MSQLAPFLHNTESLLYYPAKRLNYVILFATLIHLFVLFTININPIMQALHLKPSNKQLSVSLALIEDIPPEFAQHIGPKNHNGPLDGINGMEKIEMMQPAEKNILPISTPNLEHIIALQSKGLQNKTLDNIALNNAALNLHPQLKTKIISAATYQHEDAAYLYRWQQYIESVASETYPNQALENNITGQLRLLVALNSDGSVYNVSIRKSSGQEVLDRAALDIVQKAQPFESIPAKMLQDNQIIEIIRTWDFRGKLQVTI